MDAPTLIYLLAVVAYSIYNWWKKSNKDSKKPENSAPKTEKPEVPEWMKEIFGDVLGEEKQPKPQPAASPEPKPVVQTEKAPPTRKTESAPSRRILEVERPATARPASTSVSQSTTFDTRSLESLESLEDAYAEPKARKQVAEATVAQQEQPDLLPSSGDDWRRAIILQTVLERHEAVR